MHAERTHQVKKNDSNAALACVATLCMLNAHTKPGRMTPMLHGHAWCRCEGGQCTGKTACRTPKQQLGCSALHIFVIQGFNSLYGTLTRRLYAGYRCEGGQCTGKTACRTPKQQSFCAVWLLSITSLQQSSSGVHCLSHLAGTCSSTCLSA